jgi:hypothetical protein
MPMPNAMQSMYTSSSTFAPCMSLSSITLPSAARCASATSLGNLQSPVRASRNTGTCMHTFSPRRVRMLLTRVGNLV